MNFRCALVLLLIFGINQICFAGFLFDAFSHIRGFFSGSSIVKYEIPESYNERCRDLINEIASNDTKYVDKLLTAGVCDDDGGEFINATLSTVIAHRNFAFVKLLLKHKKADVNGVGYDGDTPLHEAVRFDFSEIVKLLLANGADPSLKNAEGRTALHLACIDNNAETCRDLIAAARGFKTLDFSKFLNLQDNSGYTAFHYAVLKKHTQVVLVLVNAGADANIGCCNGQTVLHIAVEFGCLNLIKTLLLSGGNIHIKDAQGRTVYDLGLNSRSVEIRRFFHDYP